MPAAGTSNYKAPISYWRIELVFEFGQKLEHYSCLLIIGSSLFKYYNYSLLN